MYDIVVHNVFKLVKEVIVDTLIIEEDRPEHIAKHNIITDEVLEVLTGDYVYIAGREHRWLIIGKTVRKVFLTIVLGERPEENTYGLITARPARRKERRFYIEYTTQEGGEADED
jgi:uncharacterized DUF497 family protein